jgi:hypothetical protein
MPRCVRRWGKAMSEQPEALRLADALERDCALNWPDYDNQAGAAEELRRLHADVEALTGINRKYLRILQRENKQLREAGRLALEALESQYETDRLMHPDGTESRPICEALRAALGEKK